MVDVGREMRSRRRRTALIGAAVVAVIVGAAVVTWVAVAARTGSGQMCPAYGCAPAAVLDLSELADGRIHDARVRACFEDGVCADAAVPLHLEPLTPDGLRGVWISLPMTLGRRASLRLTELRVVDGQGNVVLDTRADAVAPAVDARPIPDDCHPECWRAEFAVQDGAVVAARP